MNVILSRAILPGLFDLAFFMYICKSCYFVQFFKFLNRYDSFHSEPSYQQLDTESPDSENNSDYEKKGGRQISHGNSRSTFTRLITITLGVAILVVFVILVFYQSILPIPKTPTESMSRLAGTPVLKLSLSGALSINSCWRGIRSTAHSMQMTNISTPNRRTLGNSLSIRIRDK